MSIHKKAYQVISNARLWYYYLYICILSTLSSTTTFKGILILWRVSRLDAFSAYLIHT